MNRNSSSRPLTVPRLHSLRVRNYRALHDLELKDLTPLTVFLGPNGSGKSTLFDVFAFLSECFTEGLRRAWDKRGRFKELRTRGAEGPIAFELKYREAPDAPLITYDLALDEGADGPFVAHESLAWRRGKRYGRPYKFLDFEQGRGSVITGEAPEEADERVQEQLDSPEMIAVNTLGQLAKHPRASALRRFITGWYMSYLTVDSVRGVPEAGPQERLSKTGDNLANVLQYLKERHPDRLDRILGTLRRRVPQIESVDAQLLADGRLLVRIKDAPFDEPILAKFASDGTLKLLSYLVVLQDPNPPQLVGIEEPENHLHHRLLRELQEECRKAAEHSQLLVTTHSPEFVSGLHPPELRVLYRDERGYTQEQRTADIRGVDDFFEHGASLGELWREGAFAVGDPLTNAGGPTQPRLPTLSTDEESA